MVPAPMHAGFELVTESRAASVIDDVYLA